MYNTEEQYKDNVIYLLNRAYLDAMKRKHPFAAKTKKMKGFKKYPEDMVVMDISLGVKWIIEYYLKNWLNSTWRLYRASLNHELSLLLNRGEISPEMYQKTRELLEVKEGWRKRSEVKESELNTSSQRRKTISQEDYDAIRNYFSESNNTYGESTLYWITSAMLTGLRPLEWSDAEWSAENPRMLVVKNRKNTKGRSFGPERKLDLSTLSDDDIKLINVHMTLIKMWLSNGGSFEQYYKSCAKTLYRASLKIWDGRRSRKISLYTGRHQFTSNVKISGKKHEERAALLGHNTTQTSASHYGKTNTGKSGVSIPDVGDRNVLNQIKNPVQEKVERSHGRKGPSNQPSND